MEGGEPFLLRAAAEGLAGAPIEVVGTFGGATASADLRPDRVAPNIHLTDWVSHAELLPRCAVVVTSGGTGTIMSALAAGVPLVVVPTTWDKPDNAQRVVEAGVGVRLSPRRCTPERLRAAVEAVLAEPRLHRAAQDIASRLAERSGPDDAARLLGHLVPASRADVPGPAVPGGRR
jgi:UDP:flavonoid glycosyltransferase YjiC (YdhE family)